jgi:pimeloyl-[acyl-carrier protein] methyl ester esterase
MPASEIINSTPMVPTSAPSPQIPLHVTTEGAGPDLVLLHGMSSHSGVWRETVRALSARWRVSCIDLPGHGLSPASMPLTALDELSDALTAAAPGPAVWVGWSLGGLAALKVALRHPERVQRLVMVASTPRFACAPDWPHGITDEIFYAIGFNDGDGFMNSLRQFISFQVAESENLSRTLRKLLGLAQQHPPHPATFRSAVEITRAVDLRPVLGKTLCPVRFIMGERDKFVPCRQGEDAAKLLSDAGCVVLPGAGHAPMLSHPDAFLAALGDALER